MVNDKGLSDDKKDIIDPYVIQQTSLMISDYYNKLNLSDTSAWSSSEIMNYLLEFGKDAFNTAADTIRDREDEVLNYFLNRATNASAESLNSKIKQFRAQLRGVIDVDFFLYRLSMIYG